MGFGGSEIGWKSPSNIRIRAKKQKLLLIGLRKDLVSSLAYNLKQLKYPNAYTGKGIRYKKEIISTKKRKQQQRSK